MASWNRFALAIGLIRLNKANNVIAHYSQLCVKVDQLITRNEEISHLFKKKRRELKPSVL